TSPERIALVPKLAAALVSEGDVAAARDLLADAADVAAELGDERLAAGVTVSTDLALLWTPAARPTEQILADLERAVPVLEDAGDNENLAWAEILRFQAHDRIGART